MMDTSKHASVSRRMVFSVLSADMTLVSILPRLASIRRECGGEATMMD